MKILVIDGSNAGHIAKSGFQKGNHYVTYNFFRGLKALVEFHDPSRVVIAIDGSNKIRKQMMPEYKANRTVKNDADHFARANFYLELNEIYDTIASTLPISLIQHAAYEADDTIFNIIDNASTITQWVVSSTDTDFIQLLQLYQNVQLWNPVKKVFVEAPSYDYVTWKALRGDGSDNIRGLVGFGDVKAAKYASDLSLFSSLSAEQRDIFDINKKVIKFLKWDDIINVTSSTPIIDFEKLKTKFEQLKFNSLLKESYWTSFQKTFEKLLANE